jgi:hypothetical protein
MSGVSNRGPTLMTIPTVYSDQRLAEAIVNLGHAYDT